MSVLGVMLLWAAFGCSILALGAGASRLASAHRVAQVAVVLAVASLVAATAVLLAAILRQDYALSYVASHSRADSGVLYRVAALWSGSEGSLLLFAAMLGVVILLAVRGSDLSAVAHRTAAATLGLLAGTIVLFANPFASSPLPAIRGAGLTPILEHPAMIYHPPILYAGLVATAWPYLAVVGRCKDLTRARRWAMTAWTLLTIGLATGANWAYVELGWGGYWAWDPVENTVLMPWLVLTAALHAWHLGGRHPNLVRGLLATPFVFVAFGAAVTRSGGLSSVHVFADAESLGIALGALVFVLFMVLAWHVRGHSSKLRAGSHRSGRGGRELALIASISAVLFICLVVLLGVVFPLLPGNDRILDRGYYTSLGAPLLVVSLLAIGLAARPSMCRQTIGRVTIGSVVGLVVGLWLGTRGWFSIVAAAGVGAVVAGHLFGSQLRPAKLAMTLAHIGIAVLTIGIVGSSQSVSTRTALVPGEQVTVSGHRMIYDSFVVRDGPRLGSEQSVAAVLIRDSSHRGGADIALHPGLVSYPDRGVVLAETALHSSVRRDVQVVLRTIAQDGTATFDVAVRPGVMLVWWGAGLIALGGLVGVVQAGRSRRRDGMPASRDVRSGFACEPEEHRALR